MVLLLFPLLFTPSLQAKPDTGHQQRTLFLEAKKALDKGDFEAFNDKRQQLIDYPLYPYLTYWQLRKQLNEQPPATIEAFLSEHQQLPITRLLRNKWLRRLAKEKRWGEFLVFYRSGGTAMQCRMHTAKLHIARKEEALAAAIKLWMVGHSQPDACDELFKALEQSGAITVEQRWQRIEQAMAEGNSGLARYIAKGLDEAGRQRVKLWRRVHNDPALITRSELLKKDSHDNRRIVTHGLRQLARNKPEEAVKLWRKLQSRYRFSAEQRAAVEKAIALSFAYDGDKRGLLWLAQLHEQTLSEKERTWAVRLALLHHNWQAALAWIDAMPVAQRQSKRWQYWRARIHKAQGDEQEAEHLFFEVSGERSYYGFLAADQINAAYNLEHKPVEVDGEALQALKQTPEMVRAHELYMLLLTDDARREWNHAVAKMDREQRLVAGKLADEWKWYDTALFTLAKARYFSDLDIRFPLAHSDTVSREAKKRELDPAWVYAVARQESAMAPDARSPAGAMGLMQLMPSTGKAVAKQLKYPMKSTAQLLEPDTNIRLGAYYLRQVLDRFDNNPVLATAAYNAGPHRVKRWKPQQGEEVEADIWVENMPFHETRQYVRRVMSYSVFYDQRLQRAITRLRERMPTVVTPENKTNKEKL